MNELLRRLFLKPWLASEIIVSTFFINLLFLASPIYVIQILSRYIPYGFDGTLVTLTAGMLLAMLLLFCFGIVRNRLSAAVSIEPDRELDSRVLATLTMGRPQTVLSVPQNVVGEIVSLFHSIQPAFDGTRINTVVDLPFCLLYLLATFLLSPALAVLTLLSILCSMAASWLSMNKARTAALHLQRESAGHRGLVASAVAGAEMVRVFRAVPFLKQVWNSQMDAIEVLRKGIDDQRTVSQGVLQGIAGILRVGVYAVGAKLAVSGDLTVGALIGASILASKALQISSSFMQTQHLLGKAEQDLKRLNEFLAIPMEQQSGTALKQYSGRLSLKDVSMAFPGASAPLFESLNMELEPGAVLGVTGFNGAGKTTLCKICVGLLEPSRGSVLVDGVDLRQVAQDWWRQQLCYVPQEPSFLTASIRDNIIVAAPDIPSNRLNEVVRAAGLRKYLDSSRDGLETPLLDGGRNLPLGIRRRMALARALAVGGQLVVLDEPTEGLDAEGTAMVYAVMNAMAKNGKTIVVITQDANIIKGASLVLDLSVKPVPALQRQTPATKQAANLGGNQSADQP